MPSRTETGGATARPVVVAAVDLHPDNRDLLAAGADVIEVGSGGLAGVSESDLARADAVLVNSKSRVTDELLAVAHGVKIVATQSIGFDHIDVATAASRGVEVSSAPNRREALAAIVMSHLLLLSRNLVQAIGQVRTGEWSRGITGNDLDRKVLFLVGFGGTARAVAAKALAFDMRVIAFDIRPPEDVPAGVRIVGSIHEGLTEADWVSIHVDLNPHTHHLFGVDQFAKMKPTARLINTSRGPVVDQAALAQALRDGVIAGAGLDVLEVEPPAADDPILTAPNVIITPHIGFATREIQFDMQRCAIETVLARLTGQDSPYVLPATRQNQKETA